jgi:6,7-dimethyl-8-ribityllumazine synthase
MKQATRIPIDLQLPGARIGIICARFNDSIVDGLLSGALETLQAYGIARQDIEIINVPGAFEMPLMAKRMAVAKRYDGIIALGAVIRGDTAHFEYVAGPCANGLAEVALRHDIPVGFGVLTVNNMQQAVARSAPDADNKGSEAALATLQMIKLLREFALEKTPVNISQPESKNPL